MSDAQMLAVVVMLDTATGRLYLQWPPQLPPPAVAQLLEGAKQAIQPTPKVALATEADIREFAN